MSSNYVQPGTNQPIIQENINTYKIHWFSFQNTKKANVFFKQDWRKVKLGKNLLECETPTLKIALKELYLLMNSVKKELRHN